MSKRKPRVPLRVAIEDEALLDLHEALAERRMSTREISDMLVERARNGQRCSGAWVWVPLPVVLNNRSALRVYLMLCKRLRSPSWVAQHSWARKFTTDAKPEIVERVRAHLAKAVQAHGLRPVLGGEWQQYLNAALDAVSPVPYVEPDWVKRHREEAERRWGNY